jgi:hypothetical protein
MRELRQRTSIGTLSPPSDEQPMNAWKYANGSLEIRLMHHGADFLTSSRA